MLVDICHYDTKFAASTLIVHYAIWFVTETNFASTLIIIHCISCFATDINFAKSTLKIQYASWFVIDISLQQVHWYSLHRLIYHWYKFWSNYIDNSVCLLICHWCKVYNKYIDNSLCRLTCHWHKGLLRVHWWCRLSATMSQILSLHWVHW